MAKKMLIDAAHPEETRVVVLDGQRVDDFDFETQSKKQLRGNIYLAKVTRVEPSLQAAFVEYGGNRHGFLAFTEIHPDYYRIPTADREALKAEFDAAAQRPDGDGADGQGEDLDDEVVEERRRQILTRRYRIQEVIQRRQIMLVQVVKEERGNKGAALTTYLSLAGRYCVLMPNTGRGGGISRKITNGADRKRLKKVAGELEVPQGMGLIIRTAGAKRTKTEIKRDYEYLTRAWETIRDQTLKSVAPALIYEESSLVKRAIRDLYDKDVDEIHVEGEGAYKEAKDFVRMLMPSHAKRVHIWREPTPIFTRHGVERQLDSIYSPVVQLRSGGYIVINQTEALVAIDVNSGRATRERNIEQTALKTNMEAADEAARQMRLRDLAGLIVIDFIDMEENKNDRTVEKRMKDSLRFDRARVQMGKISGFGLLELSRQRRRTGVLEGSSHICAQCAGTGRVRSTESAALALLRGIDEASVRHRGEALEVRAPGEVALYLLNEKRETIAAIETNRTVRIRVVASPTLLPPEFEIVSTGLRVPALETVEDERRLAPPMQDDVIEDDVADEDEEIIADRPPQDAGAASDSEGRRRRRRGRRGGKQRREPSATPEMAEQAAVTGESSEAPLSDESDIGVEEAPLLARDPAKRRRRRRGRGRRNGEPRGEGEMQSTSDLADALNGDANDGEDDDAFMEGEDAPPPEPVLVAAASRMPVLEAIEHAGEVAHAPFEPPTLISMPIDVPEEPVEAPAPVEAYEPDQERRARFFSRLNRWGKKE